MDNKIDFALDCIQDVTNNQEKCLEEIKNLMKKNGLAQLKLKDTKCSGCYMRVYEDELLSKISEREVIGIIYYNNEVYTYSPLNYKEKIQFKTSKKLEKELIQPLSTAWQDVDDIIPLSNEYALMDTVQEIFLSVAEMLEN